MESKIGFFNENPPHPEKFGGLGPEIFWKTYIGRKAVVWRENWVSGFLTRWLDKGHLGVVKRCYFSLPRGWGGALLNEWRIHFKLKPDNFLVMESKVFGGPESGASPKKAD